MVFVLDKNGDLHKAELPIIGTFMHLYTYLKNCPCMYRGLNFDTISVGGVPERVSHSILIPYDRVGLKFLHDIIKQRPDIEDREGLHKVYDLIMATLLDVVDDFKAVSGEFWYV